MILSRGWPAARVACLLAGALLAADALVLMAMGIFMVGVTVPAALGLALCGVGLWWQPWQVRLQRKPWGRMAWRAAWALLIAWVVSVVAFCGYLTRQIDGVGANHGVGPIQAIVVLGSGTPHGKPSPALQARLDTARALAAQHPAAWVVVSGGVDFGETLSEGEVMGRYLREQGMNPERILQEERSTSTELNLQYSLPVMQARGLGLETPLAIVTSDFHILRAQRIARKVGYTRTVAVAATTPLYIRYNAWLREYFAMASSWLLREF